MDSVFKWLKLVRTKGISDALLKKTFDIFLDIDKVYDKITKFPNSNIEIVSDDKIHAEIEYINKKGYNFVSIDDANYPFLLKQIHNPPPVLTISKNKHLLNKDPKISIVGTRNPSLPSLQLTEQVSDTLSKNNIITVSGFAKGIDSSVHANSLFFGTIAVIGSGVDTIYPYENKKLFSKIEEDGLIVSEFSHKEAPIAYNFPKRNRIIAALSRILIVIEAKINSGSLITAKCASSFNRDIYAVSGFPLDERFSGNNMLIKDNMANIFFNIEDVLQDLNKDKFFELKENIAVYDNISMDNFIEKNQFLDSIKDKILSIMSTVPIDINEIYFHLDENAVLINISLIELELEQKIMRSNEGGYFILS